MPDDIGSVFDSLLPPEPKKNKGGRPRGSRKVAPPPEPLPDPNQPVQKLRDKRDAERERIRTTRGKPSIDTEKINAQVTAPTTSNAGRTKKKVAAQEDLLRLMPFLPPETIAQLLQTSPDWQTGIAAYQEQTETKGFPTDPVEFMRDTLGYAMWDKLAEVCYSVRDNHNTVVESGFSVGKSVSSAAIACWFLTTHQPAIVITLAPTFSQVSNIIWRYIRSVARKANLPGTIFETPRWEMAPDHYAIGLSPKKDTGRDGDTIATLQGFHGPRMLVIMDEAAGLPKAIWDSVNGLAVGDQCRILAIGNPVEQAGPFYDATLNSSWRHIRISAFDHPNVKEGREVIPGAVTRSWVEERAKEWATEVAPGTPNAVYLEWVDKWYDPMPIFQAKVLGIPPEQAEDQLIKLSWVIAAQERVLNERGSETVIGLDPAPRNGDDNSLCVRQGMQVTHLTRLRGQDTQQITEWLALQTREFHASKVYIDEVGSGAGAYDRARVLGLPAVAVNFSRSATQKKRFANLRAECWWKVRELLREGKLAIPNDPRLQADLIMPKFAPDMYGRILLESKDDIRARLGRSPDTADSLAITFALPTGALEDESMIELKRLGQTETEGGLAKSRWTITRPPRSSRWK